MIVYTLRRLAFAVSLVWGTTFLAFVAFGLSFDPLWQFALCRPGCDPERNALIAQFHLHDSILQRYWIWLSGLPGTASATPRSRATPSARSSCTPPA